MSHIDGTTVYTTNDIVEAFEDAFDQFESVLEEDAKEKMISDKMQKLITQYVSEVISDIKDVLGD